jgi:predicted ATP-dependent endonuclease of OLD family
MMKLISVEIEGYRRFLKKQTLQLDSQLVALTGPNESGKTSVLKAISSINTNIPFNG